MMGHLSEGNWYAAAKVLFTHNPLGYTCGLLCPTNHACRGACTLNNSMLGAININTCQAATAEVFAHMNIPQIRNPAIPETANLNAKIAMVGCGPASMSCATYLARLGYKNITIMEKQPFAGGIPAIEIPQFRIPYQVTAFEVRMMQDLGVQIQYNQALGRDFTLQALKDQGFDAVFVGVGFPAANSIPVFKKAGPLSNVWNSKDFLSAVANATKPGMMPAATPLPRLDGHVLIVGAGDVASDVCLTAFRCGAKKVTMCFRRGHVDMRCNEDEAEGLRREKVEFISCGSPKSLRVVDGKVTALEVDVMNKELDGKYVVDHGQNRWIECDYIITALGSQIGADVFAPATIDQKTWSIACNKETMQCTGLDWCYTGGDCAGSAAIIEAVNDGKVAAWNMHRMLCQKFSIPTPPICMQVPPFMTPVDLVSTGIQVGPLRFVNPFGLASGPGTENAIMIKRAFKAGWGWAVTKTFQPDKDMLPNLTPRIVGVGRANEFQNIELNSERNMSYWLAEIPKIKKEYPDRVLIAAIHCKGTLDEWKDLATRIAATGVDGLQINMGCPNLGEHAARPFTDIVRETLAAITSVVHIPCMPKLGPHQGDVVALARAAREGGAWGISGINTIPGVYRVNPDASVWPSVGGVWAFGGVSGAQTKPFALHAVAAIKAALPDMPILACGGIQGPASALEFIHMGAGALQICSAEMQWGQGLVDTLQDGLRYHLYSQGREDLRSWNGQYPPQLRAARLPVKFGPFEAKQRAAEIEECLHEAQPAHRAAEMVQRFTQTARPVATPVTLEHEVGRSLPQMRPFGDLDTAIKTISEVDMTRCVGCGRCQMACMDAGYACISFDRTTRQPKISPACKGCGLCVAVCPVHCISTVPAPAKKN
eukprot:GAFH01000768.1.p1 GENE.GAFH01000768.1~~GAFH01000768.1.p1  ORF type:complete len:988 (-),score=467.21 GAFH01000768.1:309-2951(-)